MKRRWGVSGFVLGIWIAAAVPAWAQRDFSKVEIQTTALGSGLAMLEGAGGNLGVSFGADGVFLIDDQFAPLSEKIRAAVRSLSPEPVRFLLNTHWHGDHTGGNAIFGREGVVILAHENVRTRLRSEQSMPSRGLTIPPAPRAAWPVLTWEDAVTLHLNGQTIEVRHVAPAHTDGDSIVRFVEADLLHLGDTFFAGRYPFFDLASGGSLDGMISAQTEALALAGPETRIIPGHGPLSTRADLLASRDLLVTLRERVRALRARGLSRAEVIAARPGADTDATWGRGFMSPERFVGLVFDSLDAAEAP